MKTLDCPGLHADSVLAWLAAVGATVLDKRLRLHWTTDATPFAVLSSDEVTPLAVLLDAWPDKASLHDMPIAPDWHQTKKMKRYVQGEQFRERAKMARRHRHSWTLSSTMTDLEIDENGRVEHGQFDSSVPRGLTLHDRLMATWGKIKPPSKSKRLLDSLLGQAVREKGNGLGFDHARLGSLADETEPWTDPVVETLAFFGLALFPVRGEGRDERLGPPSRKDRHRQRGWRSFNDSGATIRHFAWPAWRQPLDGAGIDALLDAWRPNGPNRKTSWSLLGIHAAWRSVEYKAQGRDAKKAYGSERLRPPSQSSPSPPSNTMRTARGSVRSPSAMAYGTTMPTP